MNDNYVYELEQALTRLLEQFEPMGGDGRYLIYDNDGEPWAVDSDELSDALDHANEIMYGDPIEDDD